MKPGGEKKFKFIWRHFEHEDVVNIRIKKSALVFMKYVILQNTTVSKAPRVAPYVYFQDIQESASNW